MWGVKQYNYLKVAIHCVHKFAQWIGRANQISHRFGANIDRCEVFPLTHF